MEKLFNTGVKPISKEFIKEVTTPSTDVYGKSYSHLSNKQTGPETAESDQYYMGHFRNKHYNTRPGEGPGGTSYSGFMGNNVYFVNKGDDGKWMYNLNKEGGDVKSGENLDVLPEHVTKWIRDTYNTHVQKYPDARKEFDNMYSDETSSYQEGGQIKPNFIQRLEDPNRKSIPDWTSFKRKPLFNNRGEFTNNYVDDLINSQYPSISTHKMGYEYYPDDSGRAVVYPEVQEINGKLVDFTRPPYHSWAGYYSALDRGDYLTMKDLEEARKWVETYKDRYKNLK